MSLVKCQDNIHNNNNNNCRSSSSNNNNKCQEDISNLECRINIINILRLDLPFRRIWLVCQLLDLKRCTTALLMLRILHPRLSLSLNRDRNRNLKLNRSFIRTGARLKILMRRKKFRLLTTVYLRILGSSFDLLGQTFLFSCSFFSF